MGLGAVAERVTAWYWCSLGWRGTVNEIVPPLVTAADGERAPGFAPQAPGHRDRAAMHKIPGH